MIALRVNTKTMQQQPEQQVQWVRHDLQVQVSSCQRLVLRAAAKAGGAAGAAAAGAAAVSVAGAVDAAGVALVQGVGRDLNGRQGCASALQQVVAGAAAAVLAKATAALRL